MVAWLTAVVRQTPTGHTPSTGRTLPRSAFPGQEPPRRPPRPPTPVVHRSGLLTTAAYKRPPTSVRRPSPPEHGRPAWSGSTSARQQRNISVSIDRPTSAPSKRKPLKSTAPRAEELEGSHASPRVGGQTGSNQSEASVSRQSSRHSSIAPSAAPSPAPMPTRLPPLSIESGESKPTVEGATFLTAVEEAPAALPAEPTAAASPRDSPRHAPAIGTDFEGAIAARSAEPATIGMMKLHQAKVVRQRAARAVQPARTERAVRAERPAKVRGAHCHPPLRTELPPWKVSWPPKVMAAADKFDRSHCKHWDTAEKAYFELGRDETHIARLELFSHAMLELRRGRYCEPVELGTIQTFAMRAGKEKARKPWKLEESIWAPRPKWADSGSFWDTDKVERRMFDSDWARCLSCGIGRLILRLDDEDDDDADGSDEVKEVADVLWEFHDLINVMFDYYAAQGASSDITEITPNGFQLFASDCGLPDKRSKFSKTADFDRLFIAVNATNGKASDESYNRKKALNRQEFLQACVHIGCMRYVMTGEVGDVSDAIHRVFTNDIEPKLDPRVFIEANIFRDRYAYTEECDRALRKHEASLRLLYDRTAKLRGQSAAKGVANNLVSIDTWKDFCRLFELVDVDLTEKHVTLAFVWSRTRVVNEQSELGRIKVTHLAFEDFLEALCRCSVCKAWPTCEEVAAGGSGSTGAHLINMRRDTPEAYSELQQNRAVAWGGEPLQPIEACVEHLCSLLVVSCRQLGKGGGKTSIVAATSGASLDAGRTPSLTEKEVAAFMKLQTSK